MRLEPPAPDTLSPAQLAIIGAAQADALAHLDPCATLLLHSPQLAIRMQRIGQCVRLHNSLPALIRELAVLVTARYWSSAPLWHAHRPLALAAGLDAGFADDIAGGGTPRATTSAVETALRFCTELHRDKSVSDAAYFAAAGAFGETGVVDLIGLCGYQSLACMCLNLGAADHAGPALPAVSTPMPVPVPAPQRAPMANLAREHMSGAQRSASDQLCANGKSVSIPMQVFLRSPALALASQSVSEYLRLEAPLASQIAEFCISITGKYWGAATMWKSHSAQAIKLGVRPETISQLEQGKRPAGMTPEQAAAHDFCTELHWKKTVSDTALQAALVQFGHERTVELVGVCAYYTLSAMILNTGRR